jgi:hypothetical protein
MPVATLRAMATTDVERIAWAELRTRAQHLRTRAAAAGDAGLSLRVADLLELLPLPYEPEPLPDDATDEEIAEAEREPLDFAEDVLKRHGVRCRPAPGDVGPDGVVVLRPSNRYAIQGALAIGILALAAGAATSTIALAVFLPVVAIGAWLAWAQIDRLDRWTPRIVPRGRILGALLMIVLLAVASILVVQPGRLWVRERGLTRDALALAAQANAQVDGGDVVGARASIDGALRLKPELGEVQVVRDKVLVAQLRAEQNALLASQAAYDRAEAALAAGDVDAAIEALTALGAFADAPTRLAEIRREAAEAALADAETALRRDDASTAFELYSDAVGYDPAVADQALVARISAALGGG